MSAVADLLAASGGAFAKFPTIGTSHEGTVLATEVRQRTEFGSGKPLTWDNGDPQQEIVVTLQTEERDPSIENDDGVRKVVIKAWGPQMRELKRAVSASGAKDLAKGGFFGMSYTADGEPSKPGFPAPKLFTMEFEPPSATAGLLGGGEQGAPAQTPAQQSQWGVDPAQTQQPAAAPAATPDPAAGGDDPVAKATQLIALGIDDQTIHGTTGVDLTVIAALRANAS